MWRLSRSGRRLATAVAMVGALSIGACSESTPTAPAGAPGPAGPLSPTPVSVCSFEVSKEELTKTVPGSGGELTAAVVTAESCAWSASSDSPFITVKSQTVSSGNGTVRFNVAANPGELRKGAVTIAGQTITITQAAKDGSTPPAPPAPDPDPTPTPNPPAPTPTPDPASCTFVLSPKSKEVSSAATSFQLSVTTQAGCTWTAEVEPSFLSLSGKTTFVGSGTVRVNVAANKGSARLSGVVIAVRVNDVIVAGDVATVRQAKYEPDPNGPCTFVINLGNLTITSVAPAHPLDLWVNTAPGCRWTASTSASFMTLVGPSSFTGPGEARFHVTANRGGERTAIADVAGQVVTITQQGGAPSHLPDCTVDLSSSTNHFSAGGGSIVVKITAAPECEWTAQLYTSGDGSPPPDFLSLDKESGTGSAQITLTAAPNSSSESRLGHLRVNFVANVFVQDSGK